MKYTLEEQRKHRKKWIEALRSGNYSQTYKRLKAGRYHCCLGVACDLYPYGEFTDGDIFQVQTSCGTYVKEQEELQLPTDVMEYFGIRTFDGSYLGDEKLHYRNVTWVPNKSLSNDNDRGLSFNDIADIIEKEPEGLIWKKI